jgi:hypothetical protein
MMEIVRVARDHKGALATGREHDRRIDHIRRSRSPAENPCRLGKHTIERRNLGRRPRKQRAKWHLPRSIPPRLGDDTRGNQESGARAQCLATERPHPGIPSLEGDEGARV